MICLDTNYLIGALIPATEEAERVTLWLDHGEPLGIPAIAWYEFLCGPVSSEEIQLARSILTAGLLTFDDPQAVESARLFNLASRKRSLRVDAMIAGTAIAARARLATRNRTDFDFFIPHGLQLI